jgi:hypothetical protein
MGQQHNGDDLVRFETNIWQQLAFKYSGPRACAAKKPGEKRMMFTLVDGRVLFTTEKSAETIAALNVKPGELIEAAMLEKRDGSRKWVEFHAKRVGPPIETTASIAARQATQATPLANKLEQSITAHNNAAHNKPQVTPAGPPVKPPVTAVAAPAPGDEDDPGRRRPTPLEAHAANGASNGASNGAYNPTGWRDYIEGQAKTLIDIAAACHKYAVEKYPMLKAEDVSDLVTTAYIQNTAKPGYR